MEVQSGPYNYIHYTLQNVVTQCISFYVYLTTLLISSPYSFYDRMINKYGTVGGMRIYSGKDPPQQYIVRHKYHVI
jgi:hypothetical protein